MTIPSSRSLIFEVKSTGSKVAFIRVLRLGLNNFAFVRLRTSSEIFWLLQKTSDVFWILRKWSCRLQKSQHSQDKNLPLISHKKLAGIHVHVVISGWKRSVHVLFLRVSYCRCNVKSTSLWRTGFCFLLGLRNLMSAKFSTESVSYTHLTLPTIYSV